MISINDDGDDGDDDDDDDFFLQSSRLDDR